MCFIHRHSRLILKPYLTLFQQGRAPLPWWVVANQHRSKQLRFRLLQITGIILSIAAYLVAQGRNVAMVFEKADAFVAAPLPLPGFIRKSRLLAVLSPHMHLRTRLE